MIEMQRLQPEIRRLQVQYKDDRQKLNEELMAFYKEHEINPVGGCLPLLIQAPVFSILFYVVRGLTNPASSSPSRRSSRPTTRSRPGRRDRRHRGVPAEVPQQLRRAVPVAARPGPHERLRRQPGGEPRPGPQRGLLHAPPYIFIVAVIAFLCWYQQRQIMGRNAGAEVSQQQKLDDAHRAADGHVPRCPPQPCRHLGLLPGLDAVAPCSSTTSPARSITARTRWASKRQKAMAELRVRPRRRRPPARAGQRIEGEGRRRGQPGPG